MSAMDKNGMKVIFSAIALHALLSQEREASQVLSADDRVARLATKCITEQAIEVGSKHVDKLDEAGLLEGILG